MTVSSLDKEESPNVKTLSSYAAAFETYISKTPHEVNDDVREWLDCALLDLTLDARILEVGSGSGRDATYLRGKGYTPKCSDAVVGFVNILKKRGFDACSLNILEEDFPGKYDLILANAVLLHFTPLEIRSVLGKIRSALNTRGRFAFTLKAGEGENWSQEKLGRDRYFCFWTKSNIGSLLSQAGFSAWTIREDNPGHEQAKWLYVIALADTPTS